MKISTRKASVYIPGFHPVKVFKLWNQLRKLTLPESQALAEHLRKHHPDFTVTQTVEKAD